MPSEQSSSGEATLEDVRDEAWRLLDAITSRPGWLLGRPEHEIRALARFRFVLERCRS